ncbi:hypothetical protein [Kaistia granuli]|uniref:hypothetical protein n=1 Tax=Kaistia granuli TaxID=363259 RepID=UPI00036880C5|nr:hypothetical protein [Kaistia granuli]
MRAFLAVLAISTGLAGLTGLAGCTTNQNAPAIEAMNPVNACGPGGSSNAEDCPSSRR